MPEDKCNHICPEHHTGFKIFKNIYLGGGKKKRKKNLSLQGIWEYNIEIYKQMEKRY